MLVSPSLRKLWSSKCHGFPLHGIQVSALLQGGPESGEFGGQASWDGSPKSETRATVRA